MRHVEIYDYVLSKYNIALGVDEIIKIVSDDLNIEIFMEENYGC